MAKNKVFEDAGLDAWEASDTKWAVYVPNDVAHKELANDLWHTPGVSPVTYQDGHCRVAGWHFTGDIEVLAKTVAAAASSALAV